MGNFVKKEDEALIDAFRTRGKRRLNRVFDAIGFVYLDYPRLAQSRGKKRKIISKPPTAALKPNRTKVTMKC